MITVNLGRGLWVYNHKKNKGFYLGYPFHELKKFLNRYLMFRSGMVEIHNGKGYKTGNGVTIRLHRTTIGNPVWISFDGKREIS